MKCIDLSRVLRQFKRNWTKVLEPKSIEEVSRQEGVEWRKRLLDPVRITNLRAYLNDVRDGPLYLAEYADK